MIITTEFLEEIQDEQGLTNGQTYLLGKFAGEEPWEGKELVDHHAAHLRQCRGYRGLPESVRLFKGWM